MNFIHVILPCGCFGEKEHVVLPPNYKETDLEKLHDQCGAATER